MQEFESIETMFLSPAFLHYSFTSFAEPSHDEKQPDSMHPTSVPAWGIWKNPTSPGFMSVIPWWPVFRRLFWGLKGFQVWMALEGGFNPILPKRQWNAEGL